MNGEYCILNNYGSYDKFINSQYNASALNVYNFPEDYKLRPDIEMKYIRYLFDITKSKFCPRDNPSLKNLKEKARQIFDRYRVRNYQQGMAEIADIIFTHTKDRTFLDEITPDIITHDEKKEKDKKTVYADKQNVHNHSINKSVNNILQKLFEKYVSVVRISVSVQTNINHQKNVLDNIKTFLCGKSCQESCREQIRTGMMYIEESISYFTDKKITLMEALICVWLWTRDNIKDTLDIDMRIIEEFKEMHGMCTTGHLSRIINIIQGFTDDESLCIRISEKDQLESVVKSYLDKCLKECENDIILEEMIVGGENYKKFIRRKISEKILEWKNVYGIKKIPNIINNYARCEIFTG
jgi:hypothetical protein